MLRPCSTMARLTAPVLFAISAPAQGTFVNFETPQVKPIAVATVGGTEFLLVCNTPDDSVELYNPNTAEPWMPPTFIKRVPVGQGPASVRFDAATSCFFTANYIGDSVTKVLLTNNGGTLDWDLVATKPVGEAPADLALSDDGATLFVTLADGGRLAKLSAATLEPLVAPALMMQSSPPPTMAVKEPRRIEVRNGAHWVLNMKGGNLHAPHLGSPMYDLDIWTDDPATSTMRIAGRLGTTNAGMAFGPDGLLYVVGSMALNQVADEANVKALAVSGTGFVQSRLYVVDPGGPSVTTSRDLNTDAAGGILNKPHTCSQPMDVVLRTAGGAVAKIYIATFGSDRLVVLEKVGSSAGTWPRTVIDITTPLANNYSRHGPRGLAMNGAQTRLYCLNQLSNSVSVIDLAANVESVNFPLQRDPTPRVVRSGRQFLYSAGFSGNGTVACSSCHVDARSDALGWDLGTPGAGSVPHPVGLEDVTTTPTTPGSFAEDKGIMVTQSLQGLVNHPLNVAGQDLFSNKPYHWRGDRADFTAFNPAFDVLMGGSQLEPQQMIAYRDFINTVMYTPNPEQAPDRVLRGTLGDVNDSQTGSGALRGLKVFHTDPLERCQGRSCNQCHRYPEGSNNRITEEGGGIGGLETAALRSLFGREGRAEAPAEANLPGTSNILTAHFGLSHDGHTHVVTDLLSSIADGPASIDRFIFDSFNESLVHPERFGDLVQFVREMDAGIAPSVGVTYMVTFGNKNAPATTAAFDLLEGQVKKANCGLAVHARIGGVARGYYFDITGVSAEYHQHGTSNTVDRTALLALLTPLASVDALVLQGTPAGSERRIASLDGNPGTLPGGAPQNILLQPMRPPTQWTDVPLLTKNWDPFLGPPNGFAFTGPPLAGPFSIKSERLLQRALLQFGPGLGLPHLRHEAARRFAVAGTDIRLGAKLQLRIPSPVTPGVPPPYPDVPANTILIETGLYPTDQTIGALRVWETTLVAEPLLVYALLLGGPSAPGVASALNTPWAETETTAYPVGEFDPATWNKFHVTVVNENATASAGSWQVLMIQ